MNHRTALAGLAALAVTASLTTGSPASADPSPSSAAGASWLESDLAENGLFLYFGSPDGGLNVDAGFALLKAGDAGAATAQRERLAPATDGYITGEAFDDEGSTYASALAKLTAFVAASGGDPTSYDGKNLVTRLEAQVADGAGDLPAGQIFDTSEFGNYANVLGQAFAARALDAVGSARAAAVTSRLLAQQCADGHFPLDFRTDADDTCDPEVAPANADVTALVLVNLRSQSEVSSVDRAIRRAAAFISAEQAADGSIGGAPPTDTANANTTGLGAWALGEACALDDAYRAAAWTRALQLGDADGTPLAGDSGAIAYDADALQRDTADGIEESERDQYRRSTAQATNGLAYDRSASPTVGLTAPTGYVKGGSRVTLRVTGVAEGDAPCVVGPAGTVLVDDEAPTATVTVPRTTGTVRYVATTGPGTRAATVRVLGAKKLPVAARDQVRRGGALRVTLRGLAAGERVRVLLAGKQVATGRATSRGTLAKSVEVKRGAPLGVTRLRVVGEFGNRVGSTPVRVLKAR